MDIKDFPNLETLKKIKKQFHNLDLNALSGWLEIIKTADQLEAKLNQFLSCKNIQQSRFFILILLLRNPDGMTLSKLAYGIGVSKPTMSGLIDRMYKDELLDRKESEKSRREVVISISEKGRNLINSLLPEHYDIVSNLMENLTEEDYKDLKRILSKIKL